MIKEWDNFISHFTHHPAKFSGHRDSDIEDVMFFACHVSLRDYVFKKSHVTLWVEVPHYTLPHYKLSLVATDIEVVEI